MVGGRYHNGNAAYYETYGVGNFLSLGGGESATGYVNKGENRKVYHSDIGIALIVLCQLRFGSVWMRCGTSSMPEPMSLLK